MHVVWCATTIIVSAVLMLPRYYSRVAFFFGCSAPASCVLSRRAQQCLDRRVVADDRVLD